MLCSGAEGGPPRKSQAKNSWEGGMGKLIMSRLSLWALWASEGGMACKGKGGAPSPVPGGRGRMPSSKGEESDWLELAVCACTHEQLDEMMSAFDVDAVTTMVREDIPPINLILLVTPFVHNQLGQHKSPVKRMHSNILALNKIK